MLRVVGDLLLVIAAELGIHTVRTLVDAGAPPAGGTLAPVAYQRVAEEVAYRYAEALISATLAGIAASTGLAFRTARR